jgi:trk system potassium uptake protein TrkA
VPERQRMALIAGAGKIGANVARSLLGLGHEVRLIEQARGRFVRMRDEFGADRVLQGDATELYVLERAGIAAPPDLVIAVTGDDEDNLLITQVAREGYGVPKVIARVNDPRNQEHFDLLGITETVCATSAIIGLVQHEVPEHGLVRLLELRGDELEVVEVQISPDSPAAGKRIAGLRLPDGLRLISIMRHGRVEAAEGSTVLRPGDQVLALLRPNAEDALRRALVGG